MTIYKKARWLETAIPRQLGIMKPTCGLNPIIKRQLIMRINITIFIMTVFLLQVGAATKAQITLNENNAPLQKVLKAISKQSGYDLIYAIDDLKDAKPVNVKLNKVSLEKALELAFVGQPLVYQVVEGRIMIKRKAEKGILEKIIDYFQDIEVKGRVVGENNEPLAGATVRVKGSNRLVSTNEKGEFTFAKVEESTVLVISYVGYQSKEVKAGKNLNNVILQILSSELDQVQIIAYGTTTKRLNTGSVGTLTSKEIEKQSVSNPLATLAGRLPGVVVTQSSGQTGASFNVQVRGRNSIDQSNDPLFIVDGVPYATNNDNISVVGGPFSYSYAVGKSGKLSPFSNLNPNDIESIEVLKDADATAIYGSRGANGVVLITTKKGIAGKTKVDVNFRKGFSKVSSLIQPMNTQQYVAMRKEAFENDGVAMTNSNAYDILLWDTTRYTNWSKFLIGGTAANTDATASVSGGNENTQFLVGSNFHHETTVFPGDFYYNKGGIHANINHTSYNKKFSITLSTNYTLDKNNNSVSNLASYTLTTLPNLPDLYDSNGNLKWSEAGYNYANPLAYLRNIYVAKTDNLIANLQLSYKFTTNLGFKINSGYNNLNLDEFGAFPISAQNPANNPTGIANFGKNTFKGLIIEPQLNFNRQIKEGRLEVLIGTSYQQNNANSISIYGSGYINDALIQSLAAARTLTKSNTYDEYKYAAVFGRINYNYKDTYLLNITSRRDGSSRFGPGRQWANFGSIGGGWIFSNLPIFAKKDQWLSFGKLRGSFGITGNDGIGNYQYLDTYTNTTNPYDGKAGLYPTKLFNADYGWESNKKLETALELGFAKDRILLTTTWYKNRSNNQLIKYTLPTQTGFSGVTRNLPALVQNTGIEMTLNTTNIATTNFKWSTNINISFPKNKLLEFPDLSTSSYRKTYVVGKSLNLGSGYIITGVDPQTGVYNFADGLGNISSTPSHRVVDLVNLDPKYYGGVSNELAYKQWSLSFFFEFKKQIGYSLLYGQRVMPGQIVNQQIEFLNAWHKVGDVADYLKYTQSTTSDAYKVNSAIYSTGGGSINYADASFVRLRSIYLSYSVSPSMLKKLMLNRLNIFLQGQNLWLITKYVGGDPEIQLSNILPPLKSLVAGLQLSL